ncbi:hypothetical protein GT035_14310 [Streptomyces sp. SID4913]|nr:hypothetical protein [Streptomyces sp. SID4913]
MREEALPPYGRFPAPTSCSSHPDGDGCPTCWHWCGVSGELYGGSTETGFSHDLPEVEAIETATVTPARGGRRSRGQAGGSAGRASYAARAASM